LHYHFSSIDRTVQAFHLLLDLTIISDHFVAHIQPAIGCYRTARLHRKYINGALKVLKPKDVSYFD
jgi:hypothetical protein